MLLDLSEIKNRLVGSWVKNQPKTLFLLVLVTLIYFLKQLPYFNFTLTLSLICVFFWSVSFFLFKLRSLFSVVATVFALIITAFTVTIQMKEIAEELANLAYYLNMVVFFQVLVESRNERRKII